ncbi:MAG: hypothetical protein HKN27_02300 [Silicimonas sp.]|nr:hypothetical protein [Silicimonas sp.]
MLRVSFHIGIVVFLTLLSQVGGIAWLVAVAFRWRLLVFTALYAGLSVSVLFLAPQFGRVALPCLTDETLRVQPWVFCALNRQYVVPELRDVLVDAASDVAARHPGSVTVVLDAGFPFFDGFPLLPHLSHDDGRKADIALYYQKGGAYLTGTTRSPIGYFAFEQGPSACPPARATMRWDMRFLQPLWPDYTLEPERTRLALQLLASDGRVGRIFIEPHLKTRLQVAHPKVRFQGCRAARHDDHIHVELTR